MSVLGEETAQIPVVSHIIVLTPAGSSAMLTHSPYPPLLLVAADELALHCAGSDMLTTLTLRVHDQQPPADTVLSPGQPPPDGVETRVWPVGTSGPLVAHALDYGATPLPGVELQRGQWHVRAAVWNRAAAEAFEDKLAYDDLAALEDPVPPIEERHGPELGPELWLVDFWPVT